MLLAWLNLRSLARAEHDPLASGATALLGTGGHGAGVHQMKYVRLDSGDIRLWHIRPAKQLVDSPVG